jgi:hypothetical protein
MESDGLDNGGRRRPDGGMSTLFRFASAVRRHPEVEAWFSGHEPMRQRGQPIDEAALAALIAVAHGDMRRRVDSGD